MTRDADIARIAAVLRDTQNPHDVFARGAPWNAERLYDAGLRPSVEPREDEGAVIRRSIDAHNWRVQHGLPNPTEAGRTRPDRLAATVIGTNLVIDYGSEEAARAALDSWPSAEAARLGIPWEAEIDAAWALAEAALPQGWVVFGLVGWPGPRVPVGDWRATAVYRGESEDEPFIDAFGPTPEAALRALAAALPTQASDSPEKTT